MAGGIRDLFKGTDILITGGTGFMGKVLIERLLRSTEVNKIYVVVRPKRGLGSATRIQEMFKLPLFDLIRKDDPNKFKKVIPVEGDLGKENFALSPSQLATLEENVSIIFNFAASLKLEDTLKQLIVHNTVSALNLLKMATKFKKLKAFLHLSTAFCHCEVERLEERLYEPPNNPYDVMAALDWMDEDVAQAITPRLLGPHPNCYTYTKRLAEGIMKDFGKKIPITVVRPSIVIPSLKEPVAGWVDSLNGPVGVLVAGAKGVLRSMLCDPHNTAEVIPVDVAINSCLHAAWSRSKTPIGDGEVLVFNVSSGETVPISWGEVLERGRAALKVNPLDCGLWYPGGTIRTNPFIHSLVVFLAQIVPAYLIDFLFLIFRQKRFMVRVQNRIRLGMTLLQYFTMREWHFKTEKLKSILKTLPPGEEDTFYTSNVTYDIDEYMKDAILGARVYCVKEPLENLPRARKQLIMMFWIEKITQIALLTFCVYFMYNHVTVVRYFLDSILTSVGIGTTIISK